MGSWITCTCGGLIHTNPFCGPPVYSLIKDSDYDSVDDPVDRDKLSDLFFNKGVPVYYCQRCGRLAVEWDSNDGPRFYTPERLARDMMKSEEHSTKVETHSAIKISLEHNDLNDDDRLKDLETAAEAAYSEMYDSVNPTASYARAKDMFHEAISWADIMDRPTDVKRLEARLAHVKAVFRRQFNL